MFYLGHTATLVAEKYRIPTRPIFQQQDQAKSVSLHPTPSGSGRSIVSRTDDSLKSAILRARATSHPLAT